MNMLWTITIIVCLAIYTGAVPYKITNMQEGTVAVFQPLSTLKQYDQVWNLATYIDMQPYQMELRKLPGMVLKAEQMCANVTQREPDDCGLTMQLNRIHLEEILEMDRLFPKGNNRKRRGLLNVIGTMGKALFGLMDNEDAQFLNEKIDELQEGQEKLLHFGQQQTTIMKSMVDYFNDTTDQLTTQQKELEENMNKLVDTVNKLQSQVGKIEHKLVILHQLNEMVQFVSSKLMMFRSKQRMLVQAITILHQQPNVPMLIHPDMLLTQLQYVQRSSGKDVELPIVPEADNLRFYYQMIEPEIAVVPNRLIINFRIPLVEREVFTLYQVVNIPIQINTKEYQILEITKPYLAVNKKRDSFLELSASTLRSCKEATGNLTVCKHGVTYRLPAHSSCEMDLFVQPDKMSQTCRLTSINITKSLWFELVEEDSWIYVLPIPRIAKVTGPGEGIFRITVQGTGKLQLDPGSSLECDGVVFRAPRLLKRQVPETIYIRATNLTFASHEAQNPADAIQLPKVVNLLESGQITNINQNLKDLKKLQEIPLINKNQRDQWVAWIVTAGMVSGLAALYGLYRCWSRKWWTYGRKIIRENDSAESRVDDISVMTL